MQRSGDGKREKEYRNYMIGNNIYEIDNGVRLKNSRIYGKERIRERAHEGEN